MLYFKSKKEKKKEGKKNGCKIVSNLCCIKYL